MLPKLTSHSSRRSIDKLISSLQALSNRGTEVQAMEVQTVQASSFK